jgi:glycosyltransferase involved in cell wall biosynthesis
MNQSKSKIIIVSAEPIQNPRTWQLLAQSDEVEMLMAYCTLPDPKLWEKGGEYINKNVFDLPMLEGYPWVKLKNFSPLPQMGKFWGLMNLGLITLVPKYDVCLVHGHSYISFWLAIFMAKFTGKKLLVSSDATYIEGSQTSLSENNQKLSWKNKLKKRIFPYFYNHFLDGLVVPSTAAKNFQLSLGVQENKIFVAPYVVDNELIKTIAEQTDQNKLRAEWQIPEDALIVVFCAKFLPRKSPEDLLQAFSKVTVPNSYLVLVGDGPLKESLEAKVKQLNIEEKVRFLGLVKYSELPNVYTASDLLVHPAEWEPYGLIVNEAMICGIPVIVSDRVGAGYDLVQEGVTGYTYPCKDVEALAKLLNQVLGDRPLLKSLGEAAQKRMETWSSKEHIEVIIKAVETITKY